MNNTTDNLMNSNNNNINNQKINLEKKSFVSKLYLDPIESFNYKTSLTKNKGFRIKKEQPKKTEEVHVSLPNMGMTMNNLSSMNKTQGNVIIQNWETAKNIPDDIGDMIHFPVLVDRNKFKITDDTKKGFGCFTSTGRKFNFDKDKIRKEGEKLIKSIYVKEGPHNLALTMPTNYLSSQNTQNNFISYQTEDLGDVGDMNKKIDRNLMTFQFKKDKPPDLDLIPQKPPEIQPVLSSTTTANFSVDKTMSQAITSQVGNVEPKKPSKLIDFSTFNKHLYLKDNDFLYAKRVGGPVDYILCSYQEINHKAKISNNTLQSINKRKLVPLKKKPKISEYITISKNTVLHYQRGVPIVYSIQEWIDNFNKYKLLMKIPLFKNFKNAKLFDSWRRFYKKTKRQYYTEKLKKKFFFIDKHL